MPKNSYDFKLEKPRLVNLFFEVTGRCNAFCDHCGSRCDSGFREEISAELFNKVLDEVAERYGSSGIMLNVTGGEPLMRKDLFVITKHANDLGFKWGLVTNGMLITDDVVEKLKETHMSTISISLDGMKQTHEEFRHVPGSFDRIIEGIRKLQKANFVEHIQVTFIATKNNIKELPSLYRLLTMVGIDSLRISCIDAIGRAKDNSNLMLEEDDFLYLFDFIKRHKTSPLPVVWSCTHYFGNTDVDIDPTFRKFACLTGIANASVLYNGDIFGCPNIPRRKELIQGNVKTDSFVDVWENRFEIYRNSERTRGEKCKNCEHWQHCKGDSFHTFDFDANNPLYCYKEMFSKVKTPEKKQDFSEGEILQKIAHKYGILKTYTVKPVRENAKTVIFTPEATEELYRIFKYGKRHPRNMYEQQVALIGNKFANTYLVKYVVEAILINRADNMAITNEFCLNQVLDEVDIINENISRADEIYQDEFGKVAFLGYAHSHPLETEFRFSIDDSKNHRIYVERFGEFISIIVNPQKKFIVCFEGKNCSQAKLILTSKP